MADRSAQPARRRVVIGAYACGPGDEPEANAGWEFALAAAQRYDVLVITRERFRPAIEAYFAEHPGLDASLRVEFVEVGGPALRLKRRAWDLYWYYALWQRVLRRRVRELHAERPFDVAHHATFANDWLPCGLAGIPGLPLVWGPVGGATQIPLRQVAKWLGPRGTAIEVIRAAMTWVPRRIWGDGAARAASLVVAQNDDVARRFRRARRVVVEPNAVIDVSEIPQSEAPRDPATAIFVGRLIGLKAARLALATIARPELSDWTLKIYGTGYERDHLVARASEPDLRGRVEFIGMRPRSEVLTEMTTATALLFPSVHDQASWAVAEASTLGCPVVCLPLGGQPNLAAGNAFVPALRGDLPTALAQQLLLAAQRGGTPHTIWSKDRLPDLVDGWYRTALSGAR